MLRVCENSAAWPLVTFHGSLSHQFTLLRSIATQLFGQEAHVKKRAADLMSFHHQTQSRETQKMTRRWDWRRPETDRQTVPLGPDTRTAAAGRWPRGRRRRRVITPNWKGRMKAAPSPEPKGPFKIPTMEDCGRSPHT